ncbi:hypothetical protein SNE40_004103 [Patella caerulea]|uniref:Gustatory receptor n=1 Tax=Patella caerulea TaxID=87958 RepID=A0AAN8KI66_PATCE
MPNNRIFVVRAKQEFKTKKEMVENVSKENVGIVSKENVEKIDVIEDVTLADEISDLVPESAYFKSEFFKGLSPILFLARIFGMFFKRYKVKGQWMTEKWVWFCVGVVVIQLFSLARSCSVFTLQEEFSDTLFFKLQIGLWGMENTVKLLAMIYASFRKSCFPEFFQTWMRVCNDKPLDKRLLVVRKLALTLSCNFVFVNTLGMITTILFVPDLNELYLKLSWPDADTLSTGYMYKWLFVLCSFVGSGISMFSISLLVILSFAITNEFYDVANKITTYINKDGSFDGDLEKLRQRHQGLCRLTEILDESFMAIIAIVYVANVPMSCVILYNIIYHTHSTSLNLFNIFWMVSLILHMSVVSLVCARVNVAAHKPLDELYNISANSLHHQQIQLIMFMNRLTGSEVGLTAIKMFVINRPTILTVIGMLITYFVLLVQFKTPAVAVCNCGNNVTSS